MQNPAIKLEIICFSLKRDWGRAIKKTKKSGRNKQLGGKSTYFTYWVLSYHYTHSYFHQTKEIHAIYSSISFLKSFIVMP
jgi:hypothetical protein